MSCHAVRCGAFNNAVKAGTKQDVTYIHSELSLVLRICFRAEIIVTCAFTEVYWHESNDIETIDSDFQQYVYHLAMLSCKVFSVFEFCLSIL